ncbi:hypothetical protein F5Y17DRAFT_351467 [Xylariaceae sp. FL0594]|nr:hypothetical protein F5Y17DRAFT_351467 [Xylariaceae sp. FL0594]
MPPTLDHPLPGQDVSSSLLHRPSYRSAPATTGTMTLSNGAIAGIAIAGSVVLMLALGPILIQLARWQERKRSRNPITAAAYPVQFLGQPLPGKLRKKKRVPATQIQVIDEEHKLDDTSGKGAWGIGKRRLSLPVLPPVFSRPSSFIIFSRTTSTERGGCSKSPSPLKNISRSGVNTNTSEYEQMQEEKRNGHKLHQNRREASWIDEDALHGPRVSPSNEKNRGKLSRHLSLRRYSLSAISPTLPSTVTGQGRGFAHGGFSQGRDGDGADRLHRGMQHPAPGGDLPAGHIRMVQPGLRYSPFRTVQCRTPGIARPRPSNQRTDWLATPGCQRLI